jgi:hypothetical protein
MSLKDSEMWKERLEEEKTWMERYMESLVGCKIHKTGVTDDGFPYFEIVAPDGSQAKIEVSQDEEGNGPGFLFGLKTPA